MKKLIVSIIILLACKIGGAQYTAYPIGQALGNNSSTIVNTNTIKATQGVIFGSFTDTTSANLLPYLKFYTGVGIWCTGDSSFYINQKSAYGNFWFKVGGAAGGATGINWSLTRNNLVTAPANYGFGTASNDNIPIYTNNTLQLLVPNGTGVVRQNSAIFKPVVIDTVNKTLGWGEGGTTILPSGWALQVDHDETKASNLWVQGAYEVGRLYKNCFYEFWVKPGDSCEYIISTGYGGAHLILFGFSGGTTGKLTLTGNMWYNGSNIASLIGQDTILTNTVHVIAVAYDGTWITTFIDGVPSRRVAYTGYRSILSTPADVDLFIFGSDHSKFKGYGYKFRGFETGTVAPPVGTTGPYAPKQNWQSSAGAYFQYDVTTPNVAINNQGQGDGGVKFTAALNSGASYNEFVAGGSINPAYLPQWVQMPMTQTAYSGTIPTPAGSPKVYDHFSRLDRVPAWENTPALGNTEGGSAGVKTWAMSGGGYAGIIHNQAYFSTSIGEYAYVTSSSATDSIIVIRGVGSEEGIAVIARRQDANNYLEFYVSGGYGYLRQYVAGTPTAKGDFAMPGGWTTVTLVVSGNFAQVYTGVTKQINNADISTGATTAVGVGFGAYNSFVRISSFICY